MRKSLLNILQYIFFLGLGILLLWYTTKNLSNEEISLLKQSLKEANYILIVPVMIMLLLSHYSRALRWKILMEPLGFNPSSVNTFFAVMLGYFFNLLVPRLGEVMKCTLLARYEKTPVDKLIGTMVAERAFDFLCLLLVIFITIILQINVVGEYAATEFKKIFFDTAGNFRIQRLIITLASIAVIFYLARFLLRRFRHIKPVEKINQAVKGIWLGLTGVQFVKNKTAFFLHTVFIWSMYLISIRIGFYAMESVSHLGMKPSFSILSFGSVAMIVTQGGIGAYQLAVEKVLALYDVSEVNGLAYGWLLWSVQTIMVIVIGLLCLLLLPIYNRKK